MCSTSGSGGNGETLSCVRTLYGINRAVSMALGNTKVVIVAVPRHVRSQGEAEDVRISKLVSCREAGMEKGNNAIHTKREGMGDNIGDKDGV
jgi:hypothetical protein